MHDDVIKWRHFPRYWPFVRRIHRSPMNSPHKGQWRGALMFSLICVWINGWVNNREAGDLRRKRAHYDVIVIGSKITGSSICVREYDDVMETLSAALAFLRGDPPVTDGFPSWRVSHAELWCFHWYWPKQAVKKTVDMPAIWVVHY